MQEAGSLIQRRAFLKLSGGAAAAVAIGDALPAASQPPAAGRRAQPRKPIVLRSRQLEVVLDAQDALPYEFRLLPGGARIGGEHAGQPIAVSICARGATEVAKAQLQLRSAKANAVQADFAFAVQVGGKAAATFTIRYALEGATVYVSLENPQEETGFELIEVAMPGLASVREEDKGAWLAHGEDGGNLAELAGAKPSALPPNTFWGNVLATLPVLVVGHSAAVCVQEVTSFMDGSVLAVEGEPGRRVAHLGTSKVHRINGRLCYDMNTGPSTPRSCGNERTPNLLVGQRSVCRLDFLPATGDATQDWLAAAKFVRARMPTIPTHFYDDKVVYGIRCDEPSFPKPAATFPQCRELIAKVAALTGRAPQVVHLWGWQYRGKDTGYPAVAEVNERIGGYDAMMRLMQDAPALNAIVTLSDNYDDAYRSSPEWDEAIVARRPDGELWKSRNWTGEDSYVLGMAKYAAKKALERVRFTCERYHLRKTTHVDVLSYFPIRNDWDPQHPASGYKNLVEGRYPIFDEFARHGVDVSSEALRYAFIGKISCYWYMQGPRACPFGGKPVPMLPLIYRQSALWGQSGNRPFLDRLLVMLFYNACSHMIVRADMPESEITDYYYLMMLPWFVLRGRNIETFRRDGERTQIGLEGNAVVDIDWASKAYSATLGGSRITADQATSCPVDRDRIAFYSVTAQELTFPMPADWDAGQVAARTLSAGRRETASASGTGGIIRVQVDARRPVMVYRNAQLADKQG